MIYYLILVLNIVLKSLALIVPLLIGVAYLTLLERKVMASMHQRRGPNVVGLFGLLQAFADGLKLFLKGKYDYLSNNLIPSWPHGLDFEIFTFKCLEKNYKNNKNSKNNKDIEHVTYSIRRNKKIRIKNIICPEKLDRYYRWTLDTPKDYLFIKKLLKKTKKTINPLNWKKILFFLKKNKNIQNINGSDHHFYF
jgi:spore coat polysaccharide biosynthesis protein SpsF (cytidylyltransferase family)